MRVLAKNYRRSSILKIVGLIVLVGILAIATVSCKWTIGVVRGSGDIESEEREVSGFDEIQFTGIGNLIIEQGDEEETPVDRCCHRGGRCRRGRHGPEGQGRGGPFGGNGQS